MTADKTKTIVPGHGTLFVAAVNTAMPAGGMDDFSLTGAAPSGWINIGHTSKDNQPAFSKDGGDKTVLDSWLTDGVDVVYAATQWGLNFASLQIDEDNLNLAFGGSFDTDGGYIVPSSNAGLDKALFLYSTDGTGELGFYIPTTSVAIGDAPSIDASKFFELPISATILAADSAVIPAAANGLPGIMKVYKTGLVQAQPTISTALPSAVAVGGAVAIVGTNFLGVTGVAGVKFGGVNATSYTVDSDTHITAIMPAGSAGSAPVIVTAGGVASDPKAYTRGA
jgi:hypothetical protein